MKIIIISLTTAILVSSCGIYSKYKPVSEVPDNLYGLTDSTATADTNSLGNLSWQEVFTDQQLQVLITTGLQNNTDLQTAHLKVKEAEASLLSARLSYLPSFALAPAGSVTSFNHAKAPKTYTLPVASSWEPAVSARLTNT